MKKYLLTLSLGLTFAAVLLLFSSSCRKVDTDNLTNLNNNHIAVLGHRGAGMYGLQNFYPDNSLESMEAGIDELGADGIEMDVQLSKDSVLFLYHDAELQSWTSCSGMLNSQNSSELKQCIHNVSLVNTNLKNYYLVDLETVLDRFKNYNPVPVFILDIKHHFDPANYSDTAQFNQIFSDKVASAIEQRNLEEYVLVSSGNKEFLQMLRTNHPKIKTFIETENFESDLSDAVAMGLFGITIHLKRINREQMERAHTNGIRITLWGAGTKSTCIEAVKLFPEYVKTDNIPYLLSLTR